jgi:DNA-binding transcriptional regulator LsrR (DeoR family)
LARIDELQLLTKVARLYYEHGIRQSDIATQLKLSQTTVSRLLKRAEEERIVRISVNVPLGAYPEREEQLQRAYGLQDVIIIDSAKSGPHLSRDIGSAAAYYVETTIKQNEVIGISAWDSTLEHLIDAMHPLPESANVKVVQMLGAIGYNSKSHILHLTSRLATLVHGSATFISAPGIANTAQAAQTYREEAYIRPALDAFSEISLALIDICSFPSNTLENGHMAPFKQADLNSLQEQEAVGHICFRFFDKQGKAINSELDQRIIGIDLEQLRAIPRTIAIAGGLDKLEAIHAALLGGWINVLITDQTTAEGLINSFGVEQSS